MSNVGPVCHIPPSSQPADPQPHSIPGLPGPVNPGSPSFNNDVANALNAILQMLKRMSGQQAQFQQQLNGFKTKDPQKSQWVQQDMVTETVKVYQNNDPTSSNWVEVERTNALTMKDKNTGQTWVWKRKNGG